MKKVKESTYITALYAESKIHAEGLLMPVRVCCQVGIYSNKYRGQHKKQVKELKPDSKGIPRKDWDTLPWRALSAWRRLIWKIYDEDPLL